MSPRAANILRVVLGRARYDEPELDKVREELEDQLGRMPAPRKKAK